MSVTSPARGSAPAAELSMRVVVVAGAAIEAENAAVGGANEDAGR